MRLVALMSNLIQLRPQGINNVSPCLACQASVSVYRDIWPFFVYQQYPAALCICRKVSDEVFHGSPTRLRQSWGLQGAHVMVSIYQMQYVVSLGLNGQGSLAVMLVT